MTLGDLIARLTRMQEKYGPDIKIVLYDRRFNERRGVGQVAIGGIMNPSEAASMGDNAQVGENFVALIPYPPNEPV